MTNAFSVGCIRAIAFSGFPADKQRGRHPLICATRERSSMADGGVSKQKGRTASGGRGRGLPGAVLTGLWSNERGVGVSTAASLVQGTFGSRLPVGANRKAAPQR